MANGIRWCYNPTACGEACNEVCNFFNITMTIDDTTWFNGQNTATKCQNIADVFGIIGISIDAWSLGCSEDEFGNRSDLPSCWALSTAAP